MKILIADDEPAICAIFTHHMKRYPSPYIEWKIVHDGQELLQSAEEWQPDMIITDINMPNMSGLEAIDEIRHSETIDSIKIFILSGYTDFELVRAALKLGVADYVPKPIKYTQVASLLQEEEELRFMGLSLTDAYNIGNEDTALIISETIQHMTESHEDRDRHEFESSIQKLEELEDIHKFAISSDYFKTNFHEEASDATSQLTILKKLVNSGSFSMDAPNLTTSIKRMIEESYTDPLFGLDQVSTKLGYNTQYLSMLFKKEVNENFSSYLTKRRMQQAKTLLVESTMKIKEIATACGYNYPNYFIKVFNHQEGTTPEEWRKLNQVSGSTYHE